MPTSGRPSINRAEPQLRHPVLSFFDISGFKFRPTFGGNGFDCMQLTTSLRTLLLQISHSLADAAKYLSSFSIGPSLIDDRSITTQVKPEDGHPTLILCCLAVLSSRTMAEQHSDSSSLTQRTSNLPQSDCHTG